MTKQNDPPASPSEPTDAGRRPRPSTVAIDPDRYNRLRGAVHHVRKVSNPGFTATRFVAEAVDAYIRQIERDYNDGKPITPQADPLPPGKPLSKSLDSSN